MIVYQLVIYNKIRMQQMNISFEMWLVFILIFWLMIPTCLFLECSQLRSIDLGGGCYNIADASVIELAKWCSQLDSINLYYCPNITDVSVIEIARRCSQLDSISLSSCDKITDTSVIETAKGCSQLDSINLYYCPNITDVSVIEIAKRCSQVDSISQSF